jgi:crotonobetainyl-CoA:carnitine CoA-transferase CaiB-like acyl-CoA transferase
MAQAAGGLAWNTGTPELAQGAGALVADTMGGMTLFGAIVTALYAREKSGVGQMVETSLLGGQIWAQSSELMAHVMAGTQHERSHRTYPWLSSISPISIYQTKDGYVALSGVPKRWEDFWNALDRADLAANEMLRTGLERLRQNDLITKAISEVFMTMTASDIHIILEEVDAVWAPVNDYDHVVTNSQVLESGYLRQTSHPDYGEMVTMGTPVRYSDGIDEPVDRAPELGENTEEILLELGYSWEHIELLKKNGAL